MRRMSSEGVAPNAETYALALGAHQKRGDAKAVQEVTKAAEAAGVTPSPGATASTTDVLSSLKGAAGF